MAHLDLSAGLREKFQYNNLAVMTAGYLAGTSWEEALRERLLLPLSMERSVLSVDALQQDADHALPYHEDGQGKLERIPCRKIDLIGPAGGVNSSLNEMSRWLRFNLDGGIAGTKPSHPLADYAGAYSHPGYGRLEIRAAAGEDALIVTFNEIEAPLEHWHYDVWNAAAGAPDPAFETMKFLFRSDFAGDISAVEVPFERQAAPIVFAKKAMLAGS